MKRSMLLSVFLILCIITGTFNSLTTTVAYAATSTKIALTGSMVTNETGVGDAKKLVDEQALAGDPKNGTGGRPSTNWLSWNKYPAHAYIDLGQSYDLTDVYLFDHYNNGDVIISAGTPGNWNVLFTDPMLVTTGVWKPHPVTVTTRYVRVTMTSEGAQVPEIVLYGTPADGGGVDTTPPAAITDLQAPTSTANSVRLTWTAPGNDGATGTASSYDIRYNNSKITAENFASSAQVSGAPAPAVAGTSQSVTVGGLSPSTTYYFAMKTSDAASNVSDVSNVVYKATTGAGTGTFGKIPLNPSMVIEEDFTRADSRGGVRNLVDEQALAGDPLNGTGGAVTTLWRTGFGFFGTLEHPAIIDLGQDYNIKNIFLYDGSGTCNYTVSSGTPFHWTPLFVDNLSNYMKWNRHDVDVNTRYIQIKQNACNMNEIVMYGTPLGTNVQVDPTPTPHPKPAMDQMIGINSFYDVPGSIAAVGGTLREYHGWNRDEGDAKFGTINTSYPGYPNNANKFNPSYCCGSLNYDKYFGDLKSAGITAFPAIQQSVSWLTTVAGNKPVPAGANPALPASYAAHGDHMFQLAARYGSTPVADNKLKLAADQPRSTALNYLKYIENWNEGDNWWGTRDTLFTPYEAAAMMSADYDGDQGRMGNTIGLKNADPNSKLVMGGLADANLDYIKGIKRWADEYRGGSFPADVLNVHVYANDGADQSNGKKGLSPEEYRLKDKMKAIADYRDAYLPGKEFWVTEFGYDTNSGSPQRAPAIGSFSAQEVQGQWLVRSYLALAAAGVDKAHAFVIRDGNPNNTSKFESSGLVGPKGNSVPKTSWYYVYTMKNRLKGLTFDSEQPSGNPNVMIYRFKDSTGAIKAYVLWSPTSNQTAVSGYQLTLDGSPTAATLVTMAHGDTDGVPSALTVSNGKASVDVGERPVFVMVGTPVVDADPTWPAGSTLTKSNVTSSGLTLSWPEASDDNGVVFYNIYQDNILLNSTMGNERSYKVTGLDNTKSYTFRVEAVDASGHISAGGPTGSWP